MKRVNLQGMGELQDAIAAARVRAAASICSCERSVLDAFNEIANLSRGEHVRADCGANSLFSNATAKGLEAFLAAANDLVTVLNSEPGRRPAGKSNICRASVDPEPKARIAKLTERQKHVLRLVLQGLQNKAIAFELNICETTVKAHVGAVLQKLGVYNRARAIALYGNVDWDEIVPLRN